LSTLTIPFDMSNRDLAGREMQVALVFGTDIGAAVSCAALKKLWPEIGQWLIDRDSSRAAQLVVFVACVTKLRVHAGNQWLNFPQ
jgi:hypothetical protein